MAEGRPGGTWLPTPLDEWVRDRIEAYGSYRAQCQTRLDEAHEVATHELNEALTHDAVNDAQERAQLEQIAAERWSPFSVAVVVAIGIVGGVAVGYMVGGLRR